jgi:putative transposase
VALSFLYRLIRRAIELLGVHRLSGIEKDAEIIVLRHQLQVLERRTPRPRFTWADRAFLALAGSVSVIA